MVALTIKRVGEEVFSRMQTEWDTLLDSSENGNIFLTWEWLYNWWKYFALPTHELFIYEARDATGSLLGLIPLYADRKEGIGARKVLHFLGDEIVSSDYLDLIIRSGEEKQIIRGFVDNLFPELGRVSRYCWTDMIAGTGNYLYILELLREKGIPYLEKRKEICPFLNLPSDIKDFHQQLSTNMRSNIIKPIKKFEREFGTSPRAIESIEEIDEAYRILFSLHKARWNSKGKTGNLVNDKVQEFHHEVGAALLKKGWLKFYLLRAGERPIGALYCFEYRKKMSYYQAGFDPDFSKWSPGQILLYKGMEDAISRGVGEFDFLRGDESYKWRWTKNYRNTMSIIAYPDTLEGRFRCHGERTKLYAKNIVKKMISSFAKDSQQQVIQKNTVTARG